MLKRSDEFVQCFNAENRHERNESERFKGFACDDLLKRDKVNLDNFWLRDESLEDGARVCLILDVVALEIAEKLEAALEQFAAIAEDLKR
jgi:type I restriction enzyme M protein